MKILKLEAVAKQVPMSLDEYSKIAVLRLFKNDAGETISVKKIIYYSSIISYEQGSAELDWDGPIMYLVCTDESFFIAGDVNEFDKEMDVYIASVRKNRDSYNSSESA